MVETADKTAEAAGKIRNLEDYDRRLEKAAQKMNDLDKERAEAGLVIYEATLMKSGRSQDEVRSLVREFRETFADEDEPLTLPRTSSIMNDEGDGWFFGDDELRIMTGRVLGQFQHRVAQYNYVDEREVLRRWANSHDTRLFIRRRIYDTEPVVGVVSGFDLPLVQYLRVAAGGNTLVPTEGVARALASLGLDETDEYEVLARGESLALFLDLPAPIVAEMLEDMAREGLTDSSGSPREPESVEEYAVEDPGAEEPVQQESKTGSPDTPRTEDDAPGNARRE